MSLYKKYIQNYIVTEPGPADQLSWLNLFFVYVGYGTLVTYGYMREYANRLFGSSPFVTKKGYAPLLEPFTYFWMRYLYGRISDCWNRPINSCPGAYFNLVERGSDDYNQTHYETGKTRKVLNLGSYNYLGFAENKGEVLEQVIEVLDNLGASTTSTMGEVGYTREHVRLESRIAEFVGKDAAMIFGMGYATNSTTLPALVGKGSLIISDHNNHASLVVGCRTSAASTRVFRHNDPEDLERVVRDAIVRGQPRTHRPWRKIVILVEGIYSMEGEVLRLAEIIAVKKKYNCYLYVDEAHSIGALGKRGRGIVEYWDCDPADVDILMGTFTKSFGSVGGYIAGDQDVIDYLRQTSLGTRYAVSMSPPCVRQAEAALAQMESPYGLSRIERLHSNSNYFRERLGEMGFQVAGDPDSPVVPMFLYHPTKMPAFSRLLLDRGIAIVVVGFPATPLILSRCRFCISAAHTKEDLDMALDIIAEVGDLCMLRYCKDSVVWRRPLPHDRLANLVKFQEK